MVDLDFNKTPQSNPRRRKHRAKVVRDPKRVLIEEPWEIEKNQSHALKL